MWGRLIPSCRGTMANKHTRQRRASTIIRSSNLPAPGCTGLLVLLMVASNQTGAPSIPFAASNSTRMPLGFPNEELDALVSEQRKSSSGLALGHNRR